MPNPRHIFNAVPAALAQMGADKDELDNGAWFAAIGGYLLRVVSRIDPGTSELTMQPVLEDHRMGAIDNLKDFSGESARITMEIQTQQRGVWEAIYGPQGVFLSKTEANAANIVGDPTEGGAAPFTLAEATVGHLIICEVNLESGVPTYEFELPRQLYPQVEHTTAGVDYRISVYNNNDGTFKDIEASDISAILTWGPNAYMGQCSISDVSLRAEHLMTYDPSQKYACTLSDGQDFPEVPEWIEDIEAGDTVIILNIAYKYTQFATETSSNSYQVELPFDSSERRPLELFRMLGDAPGGLGRRMVRRVYPFARVSAPPSEATQADDGTPTTRTVEFEVFPDTTKFGNGQKYYEQDFEWAA